MSGAPFPWAAVMRLGFGVLRLAPRDFWAMTPRELAAAATVFAPPAAPAPSSAELAALMRRYPDGQRANSQ